MKKTIAILLVAVLAVSSVFAGFSGKATVGLGYNWETKKYGFSNGTGFDVNVDLSTAEAGNVAEGDIYAGIKATMGVKVANQAKLDKGSAFWNSKDDAVKNYGLGLFLDVAEAYVAGANWKVAITGTQGATSYAKSFTTHKEAVKDVFGNKTTDTKDVADDVTGDLFAFNKAPGVTIEVAGYKASVGFEGSENEARTAEIDLYEVKEEKLTGKTTKQEVELGKFFNYNVFVETPSYDVNGLTLQAAVGASRKVDNYNAKYHEGERNWKYTGNDEDGYGIDIKNSVPKYYQFALNTSAKVGYATDALSVAVAADFDAIQYGEKETLIVKDNLYSYFDASAKVAFAPVTVDAYYGLNGYLAKANENGSTKEKLLAHTLSAQVATDLSTFELPVKLTVYGKDMLNAKDYGAKAEIAIDAIKLGANGGYKFESKNYYLGASVEYAHDLFTAKAEVGFNSYKGVKDAAQLTLKASVESDAIIPGATLKLAYGAGDKDQNLLKDQAIDQQFGKVDATCTIKF
ncbi:hypothetical protein FYJ80_00015 [Spirochaetales bacterium NM-380-WT-3C1]|uniref:Uncharacterized protein n=1 Tax=Bullifex porci TaxID=2606638 RepID=A0A7X2PA54_9SPIO|nr:hypothetical protein [Bullifex porci]MSU05171.1 hypothetical protein [Bullifex porci]